MWVGAIFINDLFSLEKTEAILKELKPQILGLTVEYLRASRQGTVKITNLWSGRDGTVVRNT